MGAETLVPVLLAVIALAQATWTQRTSSRATRVTADVAASVERTKIDRTEHEQFVTALQADLTRRAADVDAVRIRLAAEEERNTLLRNRLQSALDETAAIQEELRAIRASLRDTEGDLAEEREINTDLRDRFDALHIQVERLRQSLHDAGVGE